MAVPRAETVPAGVLWTPGMMSSLRHDWATPKALFQALDEEFHFVVDAAANKYNALAWYFPGDVLRAEWQRFKVIWLNPPYGQRIGKWIEKAYDTAQKGATVVCLLPARTDTAWFHDYCLKGEIRFLRGRLHFNDGKGRAPFPSMIVIFRPPETPCP